MARSDKGKIRKQFCVNDHDTFIVGRTNRMCNECLQLKHGGYEDKRKEKKHQYYLDNLIRIQKYRKDHSEEIKRKAKIWRLNNKEKLKNKLLERNYNITLVDYNNLLQKQSGKCAGCQRLPSEFENGLGVDHDHKCCPGSKSCGKCVRGLLCPGCNRLLGQIADNINTLYRLANYLQTWMS